MSKLMTFANPALRATWRAPTIPPAGPDRIVRTGSLAAAAAEMLPPEDCITRKEKMIFGLWSLNFACLVAGLSVFGKAADCKLVEVIAH